MRPELTKTIGQVTLRPARPSDQPGVEALCAQIWEGGDYVPEVWDEWLADPVGQFTVVEVEGQIAGLGKVTQLAKAEWWLEGLRVDPAYRGQGIASLLHDFHCEIVDRLGSGVLRFATSSANTNVHHLAERTGFRLVGKYVAMKAEGVETERQGGKETRGQGTEGTQGTQNSELRTYVTGGLGRWLRLEVGDVKRAEELVRESELLRAAGGLYEEFWTWQKLTPERLAEQVKQGKVYGWQSGGSLASMAIITLMDKKRMVIGFADAPGSDLTGLVRNLRGLAAEVGAASVSWRALDERWLQEALLAAGYTRASENSYYIFERPVPGRG